MRNTDEQLKAIMKRAGDVRERKASQKAAVSYAISSCVCIVLMIVTSLRLNDLPVKGIKGTGGHYGSLLLSASYMGYVVIGVLAFLLGIFATLLIMNIRRSKEWRHDHS